VVQEILGLGVTVPLPIHRSYEYDTGTLVLLQVLVEVWQVVKITKHDGSVGRDQTGLPFQLVNILCTWLLLNENVYFMF